jgi:dihydroneopterin aldolase
VSRVSAECEAAWGQASAPGPASDQVLVRGLRLWAHVGVFELERRDGQWFELSYRIGADLSQPAHDDDLAAGLDYATGIQALQRQARTLRCRTLEHYAEAILDCLEGCYGAVPIELELLKLAAPIPGFSGAVGVLRRRRWR